MKKLSIVLLCCFTLISCGQKNKKLVGLWHDMPMLASGWSNCFQIFEDGTFIFNSTQMDCMNRDLSYSGTWKFGDDSILVLTIKQKVVLEGGELVPSSGSCGSEYEIVGGEIKTINLDKYETNVFKLSHFSIDKDNFDFETVYFENVEYWKMSEDPNSYNN